MSSNPVIKVSTRYDLGKWTVQFLLDPPRYNKGSGALVSVAAGSGTFIETAITQALHMLFEATEP